MKKLLLSLTSFLLVWTALQGQSVRIDSSENYAIAALVRDGKVVLRWGPRDYGVWQLANAKGYVLERAEMPAETGAADLLRLPYQRLGVFKPYSLRDWKTRTDTTQLANVTAAQALYGKANYNKAAGGMGALHQVSMEQNMRHAFALYAADLLPQAAEGLGLRFDDQNVRANAAYVYRIFNNPSSKGYRTDTAYVLVSTAQNTPMPQVKNVFLEPLDRKIIVKWSKLQNRGWFTAFHVEKSDDGGRNFRQINTSPVAFDFGPYQFEDFQFTDTLVENGVNYQYRIKGITPFGEISAPSETVSGSGLDLSGSAPPVDLWANDKGGKFEISWKAPELQTADHAGWIVARSISATGPFAPLHEKPLPPGQLRFVDDQPIPLLPNYYVVWAADDKGNYNQSPVIMGVHDDFEPPARPTGLNGVSDSTGRITLRWTDNKEADLMGYRVYMATGRDREWFQLSSEPVTQTFFEHQVPLNTLTDKVYFTVVALDYHYNPSEYAATAEVLLPDTIAPEDCIITDWFSDQQGIYLQWARSQSTDLKSLRLLRRNSTETTWTLLADVTAIAGNNYRDTTARRGQTYLYAVEATDRSGLRSGTDKHLKINAVDNGIRPGVRNLRGVFDKKEKQFSIQWEYAPKGDYNFIIYRNIPGETPETLQQLEGRARSFTDLALRARREGYEYRVKVIWADGGESDMSAPIQVNFIQ